MTEPLFIPRRWTHTTFGRRHSAEGWQDALAGKEHRYLVDQADLELVIHEGPAALIAYEAGYKAGQAAAE
jgi:hypothetical protein